MEAREIRIGNICNIMFFGVGEKPVSGILNAVICAEDLVKYKMFEGIPLTEEWLIKFGFKFDKKNLIYFIGENFSESTFQIRLSEKRYYFGFDGEYGFYFISNPIEYVHQLQNLYFALNEEELKYEN